MDEHIEYPVKMMPAIGYHAIYMEAKRWLWASSPLCTAVRMILWRLPIRLLSLLPLP